ncbi:MAG: hypothetical protein M3R04_05275 [bacterium]|nr:hypothetical protein [bacterium]
MARWWSSRGVWLLVALALVLALNQIVGSAAYSYQPGVHSLTGLRSQEVLHAVLRLIHSNAPSVAVLYLLWALDRKWRALTEPALPPSAYLSARFLFAFRQLLPLLLLLFCAGLYSNFVAGGYSDSIAELLHARNYGNALSSSALIETAQGLISPALMYLTHFAWLCFLWLVLPRGLLLASVLVGVDVLVDVLGDIFALLVSRLSIQRTVQDGFYLWHFFPPLDWLVVVALLIVAILAVRKSASRLGAAFIAIVLAARLLIFPCYLWSIHVPGAASYLSCTVVRHLIAPFGQPPISSGHLLQWWNWQVVHNTNERLAYWPVYDLLTLPIACLALPVGFYFLLRRLDRADYASESTS